MEWSKITCRVVCSLSCWNWYKNLVTLGWREHKETIIAQGHQHPVPNPCAPPSCLHCLRMQSPAQMALRDYLNTLIESFFQCHWDILFCLNSLLKNTHSFMRSPTACHEFQPSWAKQDIAQSEAQRLVKKAEKPQISWKPLKLVISFSQGVLSVKNKQTFF